MVTHVNVEFFLEVPYCSGVKAEPPSWGDVENERAGRRDAVESNRRIGRVQVARAAVHFT